MSFILNTGAPSEYNFWMLFLFLIYSLAIQLDPPINSTTNQLKNNYDNNEQVLTSSESSNSLYVPFESRFLALSIFYFYCQQLQLQYEGFMILVNQDGIFFYPFHHWGVSLSLLDVYC